jgi:S-adenosylmethionine-diacylglycerol 3-amino-3-carboxypropyl transferase
MSKLSGRGQLAAERPRQDRPSTCAGDRTPLCGEANGSVPKSEIRVERVFRSILYSQSWEDPEVDRRALDIGPRDDVFTIAASGDNALAYLLDEPRSLTALDFNFSQCCLLELKMAALEKLSHGELLEFVGVSPSPGRARTYRRIRDALSGPAGEFWDAHPRLIERGVIHVGRFERYFALFRRCSLPWVHSRRTRDELLACRTLDEQRDFYRRRWDGVRWRTLFRLFFDRAVMARLGRDPAMFRYVEDDVASAVRERARHGLTEIPVASNWFLEYILRGAYETPGRRPTWLIEDNHPKLRRLLSRVTIVNDEIERFLPERAEGSFSKFSLSDIFEYMSEAASDRLFGELWRVSRDNAVLSYREMMVGRTRPAALEGKLAEDEDLGAWCHRHDRSFFYGAHHVLTAHKEPAMGHRVRSRSAVPR